MFGGCHGLGQFQSQGAASALRVSMAAGVIHQDPPHHLRGYAIEMGAILPRNGLFHQPQVRFMNQSCGGKCVPRSFLLKIPAGDAAQLVVNQRHQGFKRRPIALAPFGEKLRNVLRCGLIHGRRQLTFQYTGLSIIADGDGIFHPLPSPSC